MTSFAELHTEGTFLLVNVHDVGSAVIAQAAGAVALGTTSAGHAYTLGRTDGVGAITREESIERAAAIAAAVEIPVSVDAENGWGHTPEEVAATITDLADAGLAGASIEDWSGEADRGFYERALAVERIEAALEAAEAQPEPFVVCARAEAMLYDVPDALDEAIARLQLFAAAGAPCVYAPGPRDADTLRRIVAEVPAPINALIGAGSQLTMDDARAIGVRRVSVGGSLYRATMAHFRRLVTKIVETGSFALDEAPLTDAWLEQLFTGE